MVLLWIILSAFLVSLISFVGVFALAIKDKALQGMLSFLVSLSIGGLMGGAFFHLIPEAVEEANSMNVFMYILAGFFLFLLVEKFLHWRHCHEGHCEIHTFAYMNIIGDGVHNFIDGLVLAAAFMANVGLGVATTLAVVLHEIPQEIGDFGVMLYGGISKKRALLFNFLSAVVAVLGGVVGFFLLTYFETISSVLVPFAAGGFIYIAASDLTPEIRKETNIKKTIFNFSAIILGLFFMYLIKFFGAE